MGLAIEHTASISPERREPSNPFSWRKENVPPPYLFIYSPLPSRKGFKVAYTTGSKFTHMFLEMVNQSFYNSPASGWTSVYLGRRKRKIQQVLIPKSLSSVFSDNKAALCFYSTFVWDVLLNWREWGCKHSSCLNRKSSSGPLNLDLPRIHFSLNFPRTHTQTHLTKEILFIFDNWFEIYTKGISFLSEVNLWSCKCWL